MYIYIYIYIVYAMFIWINSLVLVYCALPTGVRRVARGAGGDRGVRG